MKILFICEFFPQDNSLKFSGGVEAYNYFLIKELAKNHQVTVICRRVLNSTQNNLSKNLKIVPVGPKPVKIDTSVSTIPSRIIFTFSALFQALKEDFDLVQGNNFVVYPVAFLAGFLKRKPKVAWYADVFVGKWIKLTNLISGLVGEMVERITLSLGWNYYIALSQSTKNKLLRQNISQSKIATILAGVDYDLFQNLKVDKEPTFIVCCVSRLVSYKRVDLLIKAANILNNWGLTFKIYIIGEGPEKNKLVNLAIKLKINNISWFSNLDRVSYAKIIKKSNCLVFPSEQEGFGMVAIEAAAAGLPLVLTDIEIFKEITKNGQGTLFFRKGDEKDLAIQVKKIYQNQKLALKMSKESVLLAKEYSWSKIAGQFIKVYEKVVK